MTAWRGEPSRRRADPPRSPPPSSLRGRVFDAGRPAVMAIVNRTDDSFFAGNRHADLDSALRALDAAVAAGRRHRRRRRGPRRPGGRAGVRGPGDRPRAAVPRAGPRRIPRPGPESRHLAVRGRTGRARHVGIDLVNDTWAGHDPELVTVAAELGAGVVVSHTGGLPPRTDPVDVSYGPDPLDVVRDVVATLERGAAVALAAGVPRERILVDPTLDFGKTTAHSLRVLRHTADVVALGFPVLQALSRKDFIGESLDLPADERLEGSLAATAIAGVVGRDRLPHARRPRDPSGRRHGGHDPGRSGTATGRPGRRSGPLKSRRFRHRHTSSVSARFLPVAVAVPRSSKKSARCRDVAGLACLGESERVPHQGTTAAGRGRGAHVLGQTERSTLPRWLRAP